MKSNPNRLIDEFFEMQKELDRIFDTFMRSDQNIAAETPIWRPPMDIYETVNSFIVKMELAGILPEEDVKIQLDRNILTIRGYRRDRTELKKEHYHQAELNYGQFERSIVLPYMPGEDVEPKATYENGFLEIHIPKTKTNPPKEISIQMREQLETTTSDEQEESFNYGHSTQRYKHAGYRHSRRDADYPCR